MYWVFSSSRATKPLGLLFSSYIALYVKEKNVKRKRKKSKEIKAILVFNVSQFTIKVMPYLPHYHNFLMPLSSCVTDIKQPVGLTLSCVSTAQPRTCLVNSLITISKCSELWADVRPTSGVDSFEAVPNIRYTLHLEANFWVMSQCLNSALNDYNLRLASCKVKQPGNPVYAFWGRTFSSVCLFSMASYEPFYPE